MNSSNSDLSPPLVSIVMPAYNAAAYLDSAVSSVVAQTYGHWELLIVDDASADDTRALASAWAEKDGRIRVFPLDQNGGVTVARNLALKQASGKYIAFLDSDDLWTADKLQKQVDYLETNGYLICYSAYNRIDENGARLGAVSPPNMVGYAKLLRSNFIGNLTGIYNADILGKQYLSDFRHEDYVAWLELVKKAGTAHGIDEELGSYRVYRGSTSSNKLKTISWQWRIYRSSQSLGVLHSAWLMLWYGFYALKKRSG